LGYSCLIIKGNKDKKKKVNDKRKEWNLAKQVWGGEKTKTTPVKQNVKKPRQSDGDNKENNPEPVVRGTRRSGRVSRVDYKELSEGTQSQ